MKGNGRTGLDSSIVVVDLWVVGEGILEPLCIVVIKEVQLWLPPIFILTIYLHSIEDKSLPIVDQ